MSPAKRTTHVRCPSRFAATQHKNTFCITKIFITRNGTLLPREVYFDNKKIFSCVVVSFYHLWSYLSNLFSNFSKKYKNSGTSKPLPYGKNERRLRKRLSALKAQPNGCLTWATFMELCSIPRQRLPPLHSDQKLSFWIFSRDTQA